MQINEDQLYFIAEIGINHDGDLSLAKELVKQAYDAGANMVKFQVRDLSAIYPDTILKNPLLAEHGTQYIIQELNRVNLSFKEIESLYEFSASNFPQMDFGLSVFDHESLRFAKSIKMPFLKIGSPDFTNLPLILKASEYFDHLVLSTGMTTIEEVIEVTDNLFRNGISYSLLHCQSEYPAAPENLNLNKLTTLRNCKGVSHIGYSGHEKGIYPTVGAVALGAKIIERHLTYDKNAMGQDHSSSLIYEDFKELVKACNEVKKSLGDANSIISQGEKLNRLTLGKSIYFSKALKSGHEIKEEDLVYLSPARGGSPLLSKEFIGETLNQDVEKNEIVSDILIKNSYESKREVDIPHTWGIVGRFTDFEELLASSPDLLEIHLTWRDLVNFDSFRKKFQGKTFSQDLVVHAPEYYKDDLIDFAGNNQEITSLSIEMLRLTISVTREIQSSFLGVDKNLGARIVLHPGGHFFTKQETNKNEQYRILLKNLKNIDTNGVRVLLENMPPFPWYFGGQWNNTIFMCPKEIKEFSNRIDWGVCYDLSHALLYCNSINMNIKSFSKTLMENIEYLHISDGAGVSQEGLQLGQGMLDLEHTIELIRNLDCGFIPEIWNGHLNKGEGFFEALGTIEKLLKNKLSSSSCFHNH